MAEKMPWLKFFPDDWLSDEKLRTCSLAARGLWMDLLCLAHKSGRRGFLQQASGKPFTLEQISRLVGCCPDEAARLLRELLDSGTSSVDAHGIVFSRRMVREEEKRTKCSEAGRKGGRPKKGQKGSVKGTGKANSKGEVKGDPKGLSGIWHIASGKEEEVRDGGLGEGTEGEERGEDGVLPHPTLREFTLTAEGLAQEFGFHYCGTSLRERNPALTAGVFRDLLDHGVSAEEVRSWIVDPQRPKRQYLWQFLQRWDKPSGAAQHFRVDPERMASEVERLIAAEGGGR